MGALRRYGCFQRRNGLKALRNTSGAFDGGNARAPGKRAERPERGLGRRGGCSSPGAPGFDGFRSPSRVAFGDWEYNEERPHEALEMRKPAEVCTPSLRPYPARVPEPQYPSSWASRSGESRGSFRWERHRVFASKALVGERGGAWNRSRSGSGRCGSARWPWVCWTRRKGGFERLVRFGRHSENGRKCFSEAQLQQSQKLTRIRRQELGILCSATARN